MEQCVISLDWKSIILLEAQLMTKIPACLCLFACSTSFRRVRNLATLFVMEEGSRFVAI